MPHLKDYRVPASGKFQLKDADPAATPFASGDRKDQQDELRKLNHTLARLQRALQGEARRSVLLVLQGTDTSGKDGTVRGVFACTSPLGIRVATFKSPSKEELSHDYLWRCHAVVPARGEIGVWNRSHYEDVLVPVVNGWIDDATTRQRYAQINDFERMLSETGTVVVKFMLHISKEEQRQRLQERLDDPTKHWKFDEGDLQVRAQWDDYQQAYARLLAATHTPWAPWTIVPADSKTHRNLMIATLLREVLHNLGLQYPPGAPALDKIKVK